MAALPPAAQVAGPNAPAYEAFLVQVDPSCSGTVGALKAAAFLKKSGLKEAVLSKIWDLSDPTGKGFLDKDGFFVALKLIALAQNGYNVDMSGIQTAVPPPNMGTRSSPALNMMSAVGDNNWAIPPPEKTKYDQIFEGLHPVNGLLSGDKVRPVLINSKLPVDVLSRVWDLSDIDGDGYLDMEEFAVAMHLVYKALEKEPVPMKLPADLVPPGKRRKPSIMGVPVLPPLGAGSGRSSPAAIVASPARKGSLTAPGMTAWVVTPAEMVQFEDMFKKADLDQDGYVSGAEIKDVFLQSGVQQTVLAHIWNLCDTHGLGKLNTEQFGLAMWLIQQKINGIEPPQTLTPEMMPPSVRAPASTNDIGGGNYATTFDPTTMKELDQLSSEIEEIKKEKMQLETDKAQKEADIRIRMSETQVLQKEFDAIQATVTQLERQKGEAQKRLDELDDRKVRLENSIKELQEKCEEERNIIENMKSDIENFKSSSKNKEEEAAKLKEELAQLRQEELNMETNVEAGRAQLKKLNKTLTDSQSQITEAKNRIKQLEEAEKAVQKAVESYTSLINGDEGATEPGPVSLSTTPSLDQDFSTRATAGSSPMSSFGSMAGVDDFQKEDPFKAADPFANTNGDVDPFTEDPFKKSDDPFGGKKAAPASDQADGWSSKPDPFKDEAFGSDPFGGDPFAGDSFGSGQEQPASDGFSQDPFGPSSNNTTFDAFPQKDPSPSKPLDPFEAAFSEKRPVATSAKNDPFAPSGGTVSSNTSLFTKDWNAGWDTSTMNTTPTFNAVPGKVVNESISSEEELRAAAPSLNFDDFDPFGSWSAKSAPPPGADPFGADPFVPDKVGEKGSKGKAPMLPPKQKKAPPPPRPPAPRKGATSPNPDPFGNQDPFASEGSKNTLSSQDPFENSFADFSPSKVNINTSSSSSNSSSTSAFSWKNPIKLKKDKKDNKKDTKKDKKDNKKDKDKSKEGDTRSGDVDQLAWATRESQQAEDERLRRLREQEEADLELAIALSKAEMQSEA